MLGDDLEAWMARSSTAAAHLPQRRGDRRADRAPHARRSDKTGRQVTVNTDLIYDVLRRHQPDHVLLRATRADAARGLTDLGRVAGC